MRPIAASRLTARTKKPKGAGGGNLQQSGRSTVLRLKTSQNPSRSADNLGAEWMTAQWQRDWSASSDIFSMKVAGWRNAEIGFCCSYGAVRDPVWIQF